MFLLGGDGLLAGIERRTSHEARLVSKAYYAGFTIFDDCSPDAGRRFDLQVAKCVWKPTFRRTVATSKAGVRARGGWV